MNTRLVNPRQRITTLYIEQGLTVSSASFRFDVDSVVHGVVSSARIDNFVAGTMAVIACGFNIMPLSTAPSAPERREGVVHLYQNKLPLGGPVAPSVVQSNDTAFDAMYVQAGTLFNVELAVSGGLISLGGAFTVRWNPLSEWLSFAQPVVK